MYYTITTGGYKMIDKYLANAVKEKFVNLPGETLILVERKHWSTFAAPLALLSIMGVFAWVVLVTASSFFVNYMVLLLPALLLTSTFILSIGVRVVIDWYYNLYIVTNRKIMELSYSPLSSHTVNSVLLDQVKCTEIDTKIEGIINDILDIGHVIITFDRPTHQEEFVFEHLGNPEKVESYLQNALYPAVFEEENAPPPAYIEHSPERIYQKNNKNYPGKWTYIEEIMPARGVAA